MDLMGADGHQVYSELLDKCGTCRMPEWHPHDTELSDFFMYQFGNPFYRHNCPYLVVYIHSGNQNRIRTQSLLQFLKLHNAPPIYRKISYFKALVLKICCRLSHCRMLHRSGNNMVSASFVCHCPADQSQIIGLCSS